MKYDDTYRPSDTLFECLICALCLAGAGLCVLFLFL